MPIFVEIVPVIDGIKDSHRIFKLVRLYKSSGIVPASLFPTRFKALISESRKSADGIEPTKPELAANRFE